MEAEKMVWSRAEDPSRHEDHNRQLQEALVGENQQKVIETLQDPASLEHTRQNVLERGEYGIALERISQSFDTAFKDKFGPNADLLGLDSQTGEHTISAEQVVAFLHEYNMPEQYLAELSEVAYHQRDPMKLSRIMAIVLEAEEQGILRNPTLVERVQHNLASYFAVVEKDQENADKHNRIVRRSAAEKGDRILAVKAKYGLAPNDPKKPRQRVDRFKEIVEEFDGLGHDYDAIRARTELALAYFELAKFQKKVKIITCANLLLII